MDEKCCGEVFWNGQTHRCLRNGKLEFGGKHYCKSHFPPNLTKTKREQKQAFEVMTKGGENNREKCRQITRRRMECARAMEGVTDPHAFMLQARYFIGRVFEMRDNWAEASPEKRNELWREVHKECAETFELLNTPAPQEAAKQDAGRQDASGGQSS